MFKISDTRVDELQHIIAQAVEECETPGDTIKQLADKLPDTEEFGAAVFMLGKMSSVGRNDIIVNATMMMLSGMPINDGMEVLTNVMVNTIRSVDSYEVQTGIINITKKILDGIIADPVDVRNN
jgi:hypothetical protein